MSIAITYVFIFYIFIIITANPIPVELNGFESLILKFCGGALASVKKLRDDIRSFFSSSTCKIEEKRQELKKIISKFLYDSTGTVMQHLPIGKKGSINKISGNSSILITTSMPKNPVRRSGHIGTFGNSLSFNVRNLNGYVAEVHNVVTPDGYKLTLHRIPGRVETKGRYKNRTIILHHGLLGSSMDWILLGPNHSLAYLLTDAGYDVWLANARGNKYSQTHVTRSIRSSEYWDFSWHEIGLYDLSSIIDYVKEKTLGKSQIYFVAHSMGAAALTVLLSTSPQYNTVLNLVILLAPLVFMQQAKGPFRIISEFQILDYNATLKILGENQFIPSEKFIKDLRRKFCKGDLKLCENPLLLLSDGGKAISDSKRMKNILSHVPAGGSTKTIMHFGQLINSGRFEMFDGGSTMNIKKYGIASPPKYHLRDVKLPVALFSSHDDWLSTVPDITKFLSYIPNPVVHHIVRKTSKEFSHFDFVWGEEAPNLVYKHIFDILDQY